MKPPNRAEILISSIPSWRLRKYARQTVRYFNHLFPRIEKFFVNRKLYRFIGSNILGYDFVLITPSYPTATRTYGGEFIHRRVLQYQKKGLKVFVIKAKESGINRSMLLDTIDGVQVLNCHFLQITRLLELIKPSKVLVHFVNKRIYQVLEPKLGEGNTVVWIHGFEARNPRRLSFNFSEEEMEKHCLGIEKQLQVVAQVIGDSRVKKIFISRYIKEICEEDVGRSSVNSLVIHNLIDTDFFSYEAKLPEMRKKILMIRPFTAHNYATDLSVKAILQLSRKSYFKDLDFSIYGFGKYFKEQTDVLRNFENVTLNKGYLKQQEIAEIHKRHGVMLVPTRFDTQGVTMGEAMASGLVPVTNNVTAIPEFLSHGCGIMAEEENFEQLAEAIDFLYHNPLEFLKMSKEAARSIREQCGPEATIIKELQVLQDSAFL